MKANQKAQMNLLAEITVDNFCGGGGASTGIELALNMPVTIAINHDQDAIAMHTINHPYTEHFQESVWDVNPYEVCKGRKVALAWFSPDCKHFSKAKGGKPVDKNIRGLAWVALRWAATVKPRVIMLENVEEFQTWGPLKAQRDKATGRILKKRIIEDEDKLSDDEYDRIDWQTVAEKGEVVPVNQQIFEPDKSKAGKIFRQFIKALTGLGYVVDWKELKACDYGAPTIRKRFFLVARCDGNPIVWPEPTHGPGKISYRTAADCINWSIPCPSIFDTKKEIKSKYGVNAVRPLADNTMKRIARGIQKFVIDNPKPFLVQVNHSGSEHHYCRDIENPLATITSKHGMGVVEPILAPMTMTNVSNASGTSAEEPLNTIRTGGGGGQMLIAPTLIQYHSETQNGEVRGQLIDTPMLTIDGSPRYGLVSAFISKYYDGNYKGAGSSLNDPLHTTTAVDHNALVTAFISRNFKSSIGHNMDEPLATTTVVNKSSLVKAFLIKYYGGDTGQKVDSPIGTIVSHDRFGLVTIEGTDYQIVDIGMRMLEAEELKLAQGFPVDYKIDFQIDGKGYSKAKQVARIGNSVPPQFAETLTRANLPELCGDKILTMEELEEKIAI